MNKKLKTLAGLTSLALSSGGCMVMSPDSQNYNAQKNSQRTNSRTREDYFLKVGHLARLIGTWEDVNGNNLYDVNSRDTYNGRDSNLLSARKNIVVGGVYREELQPVPMVRVLDSSSRAREKSIEVRNFLRDEETGVGLVTSYASFLAGELEPGSYRAVFSQQGVDFFSFAFTVVP